MKHIKSSFYFTTDNNESWRVDYTYKPNNWGEDIKSTVFLNDEEYWDFDRMPNTRTEHPTKSQAKEIISAAKKLYKEKYKLRDERDKKLTKILK